MLEHLAVQCLIEIAYAEADVHKFGEGINDAVIPEISKEAFELIEVRKLAQSASVVEIMLVMRNPDDARIHHNRFGPEAIVSGL